MARGDRLHRRPNEAIPTDGREAGEENHRRGYQPAEVGKREFAALRAAERDPVELHP